MSSIKDIIIHMKRTPGNVKFDDLCKVCDHYFGQARIMGSHRIYKTPWKGDPRISIQNNSGKAKAYQVRQVIKAVERLEE